LTSNKIPLDLKECWFPVIRQLQSKSRSQGLSVLTITVLVNQDGNPISWTPPLKTEIHPKANANELLTYLETLNVLKRNLHGKTLNR
jgi:hypothetical protein